VFARGFHDVWSEHDTSVMAELNVRRVERVAQPLRTASIQHALAQRVSFEAWYDYNIEAGELTWNITHRQMFGYSSVEHNLDWWSDRVHQRDRARVTDSLSHAIETRALEWTEDYLFRRADDRYAAVVDRGTFIAGPDGRTVRMIGAMQDVTARRAVQAQSLWQERLASLGTVAQGTANEMRQPLLAIAANLKTLRTVSASPTQLAAIHDAEMAAELLGDLMRGMQLLSDKDTQVRSIDIVELVRAAISVVRVELREVGDVYAHYAPTHPLVGDARALLQLMLAILRSAAEAAAPGRSHYVQVDVGPTQHNSAPHTRIVVRHPGDNPRDRFSEPFLNSAGSTDAGLATAEEVLGAMNGSLQIDSGVTGTIITVLLPAPRRTDTSTTTDELELPNARLLVVEPDDLTGLLLARWLGRFYAVEVVASVEAGQQRLQGGDVFDVVMTERTEASHQHHGWASVDRYPSQVGNVIFMSTHDDHHAPDVLIKPFDLTVARQMIDDALQRRRLTGVTAPPTPG
jgi:C4-dicarboxylate-specific signal transduction histidine kinase